jgi:hypothetical protein
MNERHDTTLHKQSAKTSPLFKVSLVQDLAFVAANALQAASL